MNYLHVRMEHMSGEGLWRSNSSWTTAAYAYWWHPFPNVFPLNGFDIYHIYQLLLLVQRVYCRILLQNVCKKTYHLYKLFAHHLLFINHIFILSAKSAKLSRHRWNIEFFLCINILLCNKIVFFFTGRTICKIKVWINQSQCNHFWQNLRLRYESLF